MKALDILIVEDNEGIADCIRSGVDEAFSELGRSINRLDSVKGYTTVDEMDKSKRETYDVVFLDHQIVETEDSSKIVRKGYTLAERFSSDALIVGTSSAHGNAMRTVEGRKPDVGPMYKVSPDIVKYFVMENMEDSTL